MVAWRVHSARFGLDNITSSIRGQKIKIAREIKYRGKKRGSRVKGERKGGGGGTETMMQGHREGVETCPSGDRGRVVVDMGSIEREGKKMRNFQKSIGFELFVFVFLLRSAQ